MEIETHESGSFTTQLQVMGALFLSIVFFLFTSYNITFLNL